MSLAPTSPAASFDPAQPGTPEASWQTALLRAALLPLPCTNMVIVSPHPDDEVLGAGGLMRKAAQQGRQVTVLRVTDGEGAYPDWKGLDDIRRRELSDALHVLEPQLEPARQLSIPDGQVNSNREVLFDALDRCLSFDTLLVAPYERDGHPDHDAAAEVCLEVAGMRRVTVWRYPIWMWHHGSPEGLEREVVRRFELDAATQAAKVRAIQCFASQLRPLGREPIVPAHVLDYFTRSFETFLL